jgi:hypothetical protein
MLTLAAGAAPQPVAAAAAMLFAAGRALVAFVKRVCRRSTLRRCPLCGSQAIGEFEYEMVDGLHARARQQCGQCGVWRQIVTAVWVVGRHERMLEADRSHIRRFAERLERSRVLSETNAFVAALRDDVVGAKDMLALLPADTSARGDQNR